MSVRQIIILLLFTIIFDTVMMMMVIVIIDNIMLGNVANDCNRALICYFDRVDER